MKYRPVTQLIAVLLCSLLASPLFSPVAAASGTEALGRVVSAAPATVNGQVLPNDSTLFNGDRLATGPQGWARVFLSQGEQIHLGSQSQAQARRQGDRIEVELVAGQLALRTRGSNNVSVRSNGLEITPRTPTNAVWEVARLGDGITVVSARQGALEVRASNRTVEVLPGQSLRVQSRLVDGDDDDQKPVGAGAGAGSGTKVVLIVVGIVAVGAAIAIPIVVSNSQGNVISPSGL